MKKIFFTLLATLAIIVTVVTQTSCGNSSNKAVAVAEDSVPTPPQIERTMFGVTLGMTEQECIEALKQRGYSVQPTKQEEWYRKVSFEPGVKGVAHCGAQIFDDKVYEISAALSIDNFIDFKNNGTAWRSNKDGDGIVFQDNYSQILIEPWPMRYGDLVYYPYRLELVDVEQFNKSIAARDELSRSRNQERFK